MPQKRHVLSDHSKEFNFGEKRSLSPNILYESCTSCHSRVEHVYLRLDRDTSLSHLLTSHSSHRCISPIHLHRFLMLHFSFVFLFFLSWIRYSKVRSHISHALFRIQLFLIGIGHSSKILQPADICFVAQAFLCEFSERLYCIPFASDGLASWY